MSRDSTSAIRPIDVAFLFSVHVHGLHKLGEFMVVEQISRQHEPFVYREGGSNRAPHVLYGPGQFGEIVLRWGLMERDALWKWMEMVKIGHSFRKHGTIHQHTRQGKDLRVYSFEGAWPIEWKGPTLDANSSQIPVEEVRLAVERLTVEVHNIE